MVGALGKALAKEGHQVGLVTPLYAGIRERFPALKRLPLPLDFALGAERVSGEVWSLEPSPGLTVYFIEQPGFYQRAALYQQYGVDYPDNAERFIFLSKAVGHLALRSTGNRRWSTCTTGRSSRRRCGCDMNAACKGRGAVLAFA